MYRNILVPVAFDGDDARAQEALGVAQKMLDPGGQITVMHVMEPVPTYALSYMSDDLIAATREGIKAELAALASNVPGAMTLLVRGRPASIILNHADEIAADLIIVASHQPGMQSLLLGSTATHVVRHATCAVHILR